MKLKWQWFLGGRVMFWLVIIGLISLTIGLILTYFIDPIRLLYMRPRDIDTSPIQRMSEQYVESCGIEIDMPIEYHFVHFTCNDKEDKETILLGTFHEWNYTYYIDISEDLVNSVELSSIVVHETRHLIVEYLKDQKIINMGKYTEEIAQGDDYYTNNLFESGVHLLKQEQQKQ